MKLKDLIKQNKEKTERWLIENLLPRGELAILYAPTDYYKTFISLLIAAEIITGGDKLGASQRGRVLIWSVEPTWEDFYPRLQGLVMASYQEHKELILENLEASFDSKDLTRGYYEYDPHFDKKQVRTGEYDDHSWEWKWVPYETSWNEAGADIYEDEIKLLIIDTLSTSLGTKSINDDSAIRVVIKNLKELIHEDLTILVIAHSSFKNPSKGLMGSSILKNDFPTILKIRKKKNGQMEIYRENMKCKAKGTSIPFKMRDIVVGKTEMIYPDIGLSVDEFDDVIISQFEDGLTKEEIRENTKEMGLGNTKTDKSFTVSFHRRWKRLIDTGFITDEKQGNKTGF
jgi:hypothetical protein